MIYFYHFLTNKLIACLQDTLLLVINFNNRPDYFSVTAVIPAILHHLWTPATHSQHRDWTEIKPKAVLKTLTQLTFFWKFQTLLRSLPWLVVLFQLYFSTCLLQYSFLSIWLELLKNRIWSSIMASTCLAITGTRRITEGEGCRLKCDELWRLYCFHSPFSYFHSVDINIQHQRYGKWVQ